VHALALYQPPLRLTYDPTRHGPARPGHLSRHVLDEMARKSRAMTDGESRRHRLLVSPEASGDSHPNRQPVFNLESWRRFFASSRLGVAPLVIHPSALLLAFEATNLSLVMARPNPAMS
jgi:hypothetical protein